MTNAIRHLAAATRRLASQVGQIIAECNEATRRLATLADTPDRYPVDPDRAPDTYAEFVIRTAGLERPVLRCLQLPPSGCNARPLG